MSFEEVSEVTGKFYESEYEEVFCDLLAGCGPIPWTYKSGDEIHRPLTDALLKDDLRGFLLGRYADKGLTPDDLETVISRLENVPGSFYRRMVDTNNLVRDGFDFTPSDSSFAPFHLDFIDFDEPSNNTFTAVNQFTYVEGGHDRRPDVILFVNGIPIVIVELKNPTDADATTETAHRQITMRYRKYIPSFLRYCAIAVVSDASTSLMGTSVSDYEHFYAWKKVENEDEPKAGLNEVKSLIEGALSPVRLLEIYRDFLYFPDPSEGDEKEIAVVCRYPQFFAARKLRDNVLKSLRSAGGDGRGGLYFGATGCGKTYTMLFLARLLAYRTNGQLKTPTILLIVDREDLEDQASGVFLPSTGFLCDENIKVIENRRTLGEELKNNTSGGFYITTIQKFAESTGLLSTRSDIICMSDEAHRTQNNIGSKLKITERGADISHGFASHLRNALPNATYCGFTGTPIDEAINVFGGIVDQYTMIQSQLDGITVPISYDPRLARVVLDAQQAKAIEDYYRLCQDEGASDEEVMKSKKAMSGIDQILSNPDVLKRIGTDIVKDYETRVADQPDLIQKAMIVCSSRPVAFELYKIIKDIRPEWCEKRKAVDESSIPPEKLENMKEVQFLNMVATTDEKKDSKELYLLCGTPDYRKELAAAFKDENSNFRIAIVVDMWITGFDVPPLTLLYNNKPLQRHTLIQTISRVNRRYKGKERGVIIDYIGIRENMKAAFAKYGGGGKFAQDDVDAAYGILLNELSSLKELTNDLNFDPYFGNDAAIRLQFLQTASEFVLDRDGEKKDSEVGLLALFKGHVERLRGAYAICNPAGRLSDEEVAWCQCFMGIQSFLIKLVRPTDNVASMNKHVEKMVREAMSSSGVETVIGKGDLDGEDLFGKDFLDEVDKVKMPNTKFQMLVQLLKRTIKNYKKVNKVKAEYFEHLLAETIEEYNRRDKLSFATKVGGEVIAAVKDVVNKKIEELSGKLIDLLHSVEKDKEEFKNLGISFEEKAFYDVLIHVRDAHGFEYPEAKCKTLAKKIKKLIDEGTVYADWSNNFSIRSDMSNSLQDLLIDEGYPPEWNDEVFEKVLDQVENYKKYE